MSDPKVPEDIGHWDNDPEYPVEDWKYEVENDDTRQSYNEWRRSRYKQAAEDARVLNPSLERLRKDLSEQAAKREDN